MLVVTNTHVSACFGVLLWMKFRATPQLEQSFLLCSH